jgi:membrane-associated protease RseP (regulator of RpoE activity)
LPYTQEQGKGILGINVVPMVLDPQTVLNKYKDAFKQNPLAVLLPPTMGPYSVPFSDQMASNYESSALGPAFAPVANMLFWLWFINFNLGIFNALPIWVFDGGQLYSSLIERKARSKALARNASTVLTAVMAGIVIVAFALPYISELFSGL